MESMRRASSRRSARRWPDAHAIEAGLNEEIRFHIDQQTEKNIRAGMTPAEARRQAFVRFGGVEHVKEQTRDEFRAGTVRRLRPRSSVRRARAAARPGLCDRRDPHARPRHRRRHRRLQRRQRRAAHAAAVSATPIASCGFSRSTATAGAYAQRVRAELRRLEERHARFRAMAEMSAGPAPVSDRHRVVDDAGAQRVARVLRCDGRPARSVGRGFKDEELRVAAAPAVDRQRSALANADWPRRAARTLSRSASNDAALQVVRCDAARVRLSGGERLLVPRETDRRRRRHEPRTTCRSSRASPTTFRSSAQRASSAHSRAR